MSDNNSMNVLTRARKMKLWPLVAALQNRSPAKRPSFLRKELLTTVAAPSKSRKQLDDEEWTTLDEQAWQLVQLYFDALTDIHEKQIKSFSNEKYKEREITEGRQLVEKAHVAIALLDGIPATGVGYRYALVTENESEREDIDRDIFCETRQFLVNLITESWRHIKSDEDATQCMESLVSRVLATKSAEQLAKAVQDYSRYTPVSRFPHALRRLAKDAGPWGWSNGGCELAFKKLAMSWLRHLSVRRVTLLADINHVLSDECSEATAQNILTTARICATLDDAAKRFSDRLCVHLSDKWTVTHMDIQGMVVCLKSEVSLGAYEKRTWDEITDDWRRHIQAAVEDDLATVRFVVSIITVLPGKKEKSFIYETKA